MEAPATYSALVQKRHFIASEPKIGLHIAVTHE
jgi:hypothetical protein